MSLLGAGKVAGQRGNTVTVHDSDGYTRIFDALGTLAEQGYNFAWFNIGIMYTNGQGINQDYAKASEHPAAGEYAAGLLLEAGPDFPLEAQSTPLLVVSGEHTWRVSGAPELDWDFYDHDRATRRGGRLIRLRVMGLAEPSPTVQADRNRFGLRR